MVPYSDIFWNIKSGLYMWMGIHGERVVGTTIQHYYQNVFPSAPAIVVTIFKTPFTVGRLPQSQKALFKFGVTLLHSNSIVGRRSRAASNEALLICCPLLLLPYGIMSLTYLLWDKHVNKISISKLIVFWHSNLSNVIHFHIFFLLSRGRLHSFPHTALVLCLHSYSSVPLFIALPKDWLAFVWKKRTK